jgi:hypothetical protein
MNVSTVYRKNKCMNIGLTNSRNYHISEQGLNLSENGISASMPQLRFLRGISYLSNDGLLIEHTTNSKPMDLASTGHCNVFVKGFSGLIWSLLNTFAPE